MPIVDLESNVSIKELLEDSEYGTKDVDPRAYFQRYALNTSLTLNYGYRIAGNVEDEMLKEITAVERGVSNFRSTSNNWEDYVPLLRWLPGKKAGPLEFKERRTKYMNKLLGMLKERIERGEDKPCITGNILKDPEAKLNDGTSSPFPRTMRNNH
jgi:phenylacetate 2-hydroxylase